MPARRCFRLVLVKPSHYDDDGYVIPVPTAFFAQMSKALLEHAANKGLQMAVDHRKDLKRLREILRKRRRTLVATMVGAKKEPTKFTQLVELQEACDAVQWALEDEAAAAKEGEG